MLNTEDYDLISVIALGSESLATTPEKDNWIEYSDGELPAYIRRIANALKRSGHSTSRAIAIAVGRVKTWAHGGGGVTAATTAKAAAALAEWEALKAKNAARTAKNKAK